MIFPLFVLLHMPEERGRGLGLMVAHVQSWRLKSIIWSRSSGLDQLTRCEVSTSTYPVSTGMSSCQVTLSNTRQVPDNSEFFEHEIICSPHGPELHNSAKLRSITYLKLDWQTCLPTLTRRRDSALTYFYTGKGSNAIVNVTQPPPFNSCRIRFVRLLANQVNGRTRTNRMSD